MSTGKGICRRSFPIGNVRGLVKAGPVLGELAKKHHEVVHNAVLERRKVLTIRPKRAADSTRVCSDCVETRGLGGEW